MKISKRKSLIRSKKLVVCDIAFCFLLLALFLFDTKEIQAEPYYREGLEIKTFCRKYGFRLEVKRDKQEFVLSKGKHKIRFLLYSTVALTNHNDVWFFDNPVLIKKGAIIIPTALITKLLSLDKSETYRITTHLNIHYKKKIQFVILDAGHGGKDPGNYHNNIPEKTVNLAITKKVSALLKKKIPNVRIILTRSDDRFITLEDRSFQAINLTRLDHQGIFVSIHANATLNLKTRGIETYFYSSKIKQDSQERIQCFSNLTRPLSRHSSVQKILSQMYNLQVTKESQILANLVNQNMYKRTNQYTLNRGVKAHQPYFVITHNNLPSVLVEVGFLTHRGEAANLMNRGYQHKIASGIADGISIFIKKFNKSNGFIN